MLPPSGSMAAPSKALPSTHGSTPVSRAVDHSPPRGRGRHRLQRARRRVTGIWAHPARSRWCPSFSTRCAADGSAGVGPCVPIILLTNPPVIPRDQTHLFRWRKTWINRGHRRQNLPRRKWSMNMNTKIDPASWTGSIICFTTLCPGLRVSMALLGRLSRKLESCFFLLADLPLKNLYQNL